MSRPRNKSSIFDQFSSEVDLDRQKLFKKESDLCNYLEDNIALFMSSMFNEEYVRHTREFDFRDKGMFKIRESSHIPKRGSRVDFMVYTESGKTYAIEAKNFKHTSNLPSALGQLLGYGALMTDRGIDNHGLVLVTSDIDILTPSVVEYYNLPIDVALLRKEGMYLMEKYNA